MTQIVADAGTLGFDPARLARIDEWLARNVEIGRYSGASVLIARDGKIAHLACAGARSIDRNLPYERDTIVRIYSMTKMITSSIFMMLVERGLVHLDASVADYIPEFSECYAYIPGATSRDQVERAPAPTLHQLLVHTSGMSYSFNPGLAGKSYAQNKVDFSPKAAGLGGNWVGLAAEARHAAAEPLAFQPGTQWEYSVGIDIIGRVIEVITGRSLDAVFESEIFAPLGMVDTGFSIPKSSEDRFADCYLLDPENPLKLCDPAGDSAFATGRVDTFSGGGGLVSTLDDYFRFGEMIRQGGKLGDVRLLSSRSVEFMQRNHLPGDIASMGAESFAEMPMAGMGFGIGGAVVLDPARAGVPGSVGDFGWGGMASTYSWTDPVERLNVVFFTQLIPSSSYPSRAELKALVLGALAD